MATSQELLQALTNMQQNAQSNLPVIPNNGNPRGANNMPGIDQRVLGNTPGQQPNPQNKQQGHFYPWMNPSPSVDIIQQLLANTGGVAPVMQQEPKGPTMGFNDGRTVPVLPTNINTGGGMPPTVLPSRPRAGLYTDGERQPYVYGQPRPLVR